MWLMGPSWICLQLVTSSMLCITSMRSSGASFCMVLAQSCSRTQSSSPR